MITDQKKKTKVPFSFVSLFSKRHAFLSYVLVNGTRMRSVCGVYNPTPRDTSGSSWGLLITVKCAMPSFLTSEINVFLLDKEIRCATSQRHLKTNNSQVNKLEYQKIRSRFFVKKNLFQSVWKKILFFGNSFIFVSAHILLKMSLGDKCASLLLKEPVRRKDSLEFIIYIYIYRCVTFSYRLETFFSKYTIATRLI